METQNASTWSRKARRQQKKKAQQTSQKTARPNLPQPTIPESAAVDPERLPEDVLTAEISRPTSSEASVIVPPLKEEAAEKIVDQSDESGSSGTLNESVVTLPVTPAEAETTAPAKSSCLPSRPPKTKPSDTGFGETYIHSIGSLISAVRNAKGSEVAWIMDHITFTPQAPAYTTMLKNCGRDVNKAVQLWAAMVKRNDVKPNSTTYRVMITLYCNMGHFNWAELLFEEQLWRAETDVNCLPDGKACRQYVSVLLRQRKLEKAYNWVQDMNYSGRFADPLVYNDVIMACLEAGSGATTRDICKLFMSMHMRDLCAASEAYNAALPLIAQKLGWQQAHMIFNATSLGKGVNSHHISTCLIMMDILRRAGAIWESACLYGWFLAQGYSREDEQAMASCLLFTYSEAGLYTAAVYLWEKNIVPHGLVTGHKALLVWGAFARADHPVYPHPALARQLWHAYYYSSFY